MTVSIVPLPASLDACRRGSLVLVADFEAKDKHSGTARVTVNCLNVLA